MCFLRNKLYHNVDNQVENVDNFAKMHIWGELSTIYLQTTHFIHINSVKIFTYDESEYLALNVFAKTFDLNII